MHQSERRTQRISKVKRGSGTTKRSLLFLSNGRANYGEIFFASRALAWLRHYERAVCWQLLCSKRVCVGTNIYGALALGIMCADFFAPSPWMREETCATYMVCTSAVFFLCWSYSWWASCLCVTLFSPAAHSRQPIPWPWPCPIVCLPRGSHGCIFIQCALSQSLLCINHKRSQLNLIWKQSDLKKYTLEHCRLIIIFCKIGNISHAVGVWNLEYRWLMSK